MILVKTALFFVFEITNFENIHFSSGKVIRELNYFSPCAKPSNRFSFWLLNYKKMFSGLVQKLLWEND